MDPPYGGHELGARSPIGRSRFTKKQQEPPPRDGCVYCSYACAAHSSLLFRGLDFEFQRPGGELRVALDAAVRDLPADDVTRTRAGAPKPNASFVVYLSCPAKSPSSMARAW